jgi:multicomponent Na+:H+ antiporter subunit D
VTTNVPVLLFMIPFLSAVIAASLGWVVRGSARVVALLALAATALLAVSAVPSVLREGSLHTHIGGWPPPWGIEVLLDPLSAFMAVVVGGVSLIVVAGAVPQVERELPGRDTVWYSTVLLLVAGLMGLVITADLFNLFVQIEVVSLSSYALVAAGGRGAPRAGMNYLIIGSFGASLYLMGVGFLFAATGSLNFADVAQLLPAADPRLVLVSGTLIVAGLGVKMALVPLHMWMPAAYARSPSVSASVMAPLVTKVSAFALLRVLFWVYGGGSLAGADRLLLDVVAWAGAAAMVVGGVLAFVQSDLRRLLAYSSIGQMGVVAMGIGLGNQAGFTGAALHIGNDALMKGALFLAAGIALLRFGVRKVEELSRLRGRAPVTSAVFVVAGLSLVGVPPLAGFFGKWYVLNGTLADGRYVFTAALVLSSLTSVGYVFRILERLFFAGPAGDVTAREGQTAVLVACALLAMAIIGLGLFNARVVSALILPGMPGIAP